MIAPITVDPQMSDPSQKRQIGAVKNASCQRSLSSWRLADMAACIQASHFSSRPRGVNSAMKSRLAGSFPNSPQRMVRLNHARTCEGPQNRIHVQRIGAGILGNLVAADVQRYAHGSGAARARV